MGPPARFLLYSRPDCHLCEQLQEELAALLAGGPHRFEIVDVDACAATKARWGRRIPVLTLDGEMVCRGVLDPAQVHKVLRLRL